MIRFVLALFVAVSVALVALIGAPPAFAQDAPKKGENPPTSDLVAAAKAAKAKRKKSTTKVITDEDVAKSKGKLIETGGSAAPANATVKEGEGGILESYEAARRQRQLAEARTALLEATIADLEKQLAAIEQSYYDENDLDRRDRDLVQRFERVKAKLDAAKKALSELKPAGEAGQQDAPNKKADDMADDMGAETEQSPPPTDPDGDR